MNALIEVFRMEEVSKETRIRLLKKLGNLINCKYASNVTEPLVYELVLLLDPNDKIKDDTHYLSFIKD
jgi:hypothetical protein